MARVHPDHRRRQSALAWIGAGSLRPEVTASGLQFRTIKAGKGDPITRADAALLDYILTADDGTVFDSSESHGGPQPFTMDQVYPGFAEAMTRMQEGGEYRFTMPQKLAFGDTAAAAGLPQGQQRLPSRCGSGRSCAAAPR